VHTCTRTAILVGLPFESVVSTQVGLKGDEVKHFLTAAGDAVRAKGRANGSYVYLAQASGLGGSCRRKSQGQRPDSLRPFLNRQMQGSK